jgi:hypothetical protein
VYGTLLRGEWTNIFLNLFARKFKPRIISEMGESQGGHAELDLVLVRNMM